MKNVHLRSDVGGFGSNDWSIVETSQSVLYKYPKCSNGQSWIVSLTGCCYKGPALLALTGCNCCRSGDVYEFTDLSGKKALKGRSQFAVYRDP